MFAMSTICNATEVRQTEAAEIAAQVDVMLVIGDKNSSNSRKHSKSVVTNVTILSSYRQQMT